MPVPQVYRKQGGAVINFSYTDFASGTGVQVFYGSTSNQAGVLDYHIGEKVVYANDIETSGTVNNAAFAKVLDLDFDLTSFNLPRIVSGTAEVNFILAWATVAGTEEAYGIAKVVHVTSTGTETVIGQAQSQTISSGTAKGKMFMIRIPCTAKLFKRGETLRLTMEVWGKKGGSDRDIAIGHDPMGRTGTIVDTTIAGIPTTKLEAHIPFKINS